MSEVDDLRVFFDNLRLSAPSTGSASSLHSQEVQEIQTISNKTLKTNQVKMPEFKAEYLNCIPTFDGKPNDLQRYLAVCQSVIDAFYKPNQPNDFQNIYLLNCIIGKLTGNAKLVLGTQNVTTWDELKHILNRNFADQRDEACLNRDLVMLRQQNNEKPSLFYDRILHILNLLCCYINVHEDSDAAKQLKFNLYNELALKTFLSGLKEPLGTTIRCMRPRDLPQALQFVTEEYNTHYFQNTNKLPTQSAVRQQSPTQNFKPFQNQFMPQMPQYRPNFSNSYNPQTPNNFFRQGPQFPSQPIPIRPDYSKLRQHFPTNSQVFKPRQGNNVFRPNQNKSLPNPTPMSTTTRNSTNMFRQPQNFQRHYNQPNYTVEELYNTQTFDDVKEHADSQSSQEYCNNAYSEKQIFLENEETLIPQENDYYTSQYTEPYQSDNDPSSFYNADANFQVPGPSNQET